MVALFFVAACNQAMAPSPAYDARDAYHRLPLAIEPSPRTTDPEVRAVARGQYFTVFFTPSAIVIAARRSPRELSNHSGHLIPAVETASPPLSVFEMRFVGGSTAPSLIAEERLPGRSNYFQGRDRVRWAKSLPRYRRFAYREVYPGIDAVFYGDLDHLEYDLVVAPGADPGRIQIEFHGVEGITLDESGNLALHLPDDHRLVQLAPRIYQEIDGARRPVVGHYEVQGANLIALRVADYDRAQPLVIDPVLAYSTYLGGSKGEGAWGVTVDSKGNAYVIGRTSSLDFPAVGALPLPPRGSDAFVTKLDAAGRVVYSTYLGGSGLDKGEAIAVDVDGNVYLTGITSSPDFPIVNAVQPVLRGSVNAFVAKLSASGSTLLYSTYLGGSGFTSGAAIAVDRVGNAYLTGTTASTDFPTVNALQSHLAGGFDAFVAKFDATGTRLLYSTYLGGSGVENFDPEAHISFAIRAGIAVDAAGHAYVTGTTSSVDFPTVNALQSHLAGASDAFVAKLSPTDGSLIFSTYLGGSSVDKAAGIAVDARGAALVTGATASPDFPVANAAQSHLAGGFDAFVTKFAADGSRLVYSTFLGGSQNDNIGPRRFGITGRVAVDLGGNAYVTGATASSDFPTVNAVFPMQQGRRLFHLLQYLLHLLGVNAILPGSLDVFVAKLDAEGRLKYSTYLGGENTDVGLGIAVDRCGSAYVVGATTSRAFPTVAPFQGKFHGGDDDAFVVKLSDPGRQTCLF